MRRLPPIVDGAEVVEGSTVPKGAEVAEGSMVPKGAEVAEGSTVPKGAESANMLVRFVTVSRWTA